MPTLPPAEPPSPDATVINVQGESGLEGRTVSAVGWSAGGQAVSQLIHFALSLFLTRLLLPEDFGLVGMTAVFIGLAAVFAESGLGAALVQREEVEERHLATVFWAQLAAGVLVAAVVAAASPLVAAFYREPRAALVMVVTSANFLLAGIGPVQRAILTRTLRFRPFAIIEAVSLLISGGVAIALALLGAGPWAIVVKGLVSNLVTSGGLMIAVRWRPVGGFDRQAFNELFGFSRNLIGFKLINYGIRNVDNLLVGRFLGARALGIYLRGYGILLLPSRQISRVIGNVMFSSLARLQSDPARVKRAYLKTISVIALVAMPAMAGLAVVTEEAVLVLFGPKWEDAVPLIRLFCLSGILESVGTTTGWLFQSQGRTDLLFRWGIFASVFPLAGIAIGVAQGTVFAVALGYVVGSWLLLYPVFSVPGRLIGMSFADVVRALSGVIGVTALMAAAAWSVGLLIPSSWGPASLLLIRSVVGASAYALLLALFRPSPYRDLRRIVAERIRGRRARRSSSTPPAVA